MVTTKYKLLKSERELSQKFRDTIANSYHIENWYYEQYPTGIGVKTVLVLELDFIVGDEMDVKLTVDITDYEAW